MLTLPHVATAQGTKTLAAILKDSVAKTNRIIKYV